eukprot:TRINITY_DN1705_c0_g1_i7.p1 TRINITY_DN1705_c0_g1~~TRINITY_DN1705_c0_g1_i7.p1  ORF type:complete len:569 (-),score=89.30 TRINITY_DN1705_c0_g1_i7:60-1766(-)
MDPFNEHFLPMRSADLLREYFSGPFPSRLAPAPFRCDFRAYSFAMEDRLVQGDSDKIIMPTDVLATLVQSGMQFPYIFQITNRVQGMHIHGSVLEFTAKPGTVLLPFWMMEHLAVQEGGTVVVESVSLPKCTWAVFQPTDKRFYAIENHKALLESALRKFSTLSSDTVIYVEDPARGERHALRVKALKPRDAVLITDADVNVEFEPLAADSGEQQHQEELQAKAKAAAEVASPAPAPAAEAPTPAFVAFQGEGHRQEAPTTGVLCPNCQTRIPEAHFELHRLRCERLNTLCGICGAKILRTEKKQHSDSVHGTVTCGCGLQLDRYFEAEHKLTECPLRLMRCEHCSLQVPFRDLANHTAYCGARTEVCDACGRSYLTKNAKRHQTECPAAAAGAIGDADLFPCPHCQVPFLDVSSLETHVATCPSRPQSHQPSLKPMPIDVDADEPFVCPHCQAPFSEIRQLQAHVATCAHEQPVAQTTPIDVDADIFPCPRCGAPFMDCEQLVHHAETCPDRQPQPQQPAPKPVFIPTHQLSTCTECGVPLAPWEVADHVATCVARHPEGRPRWQWR